MGNIESPLRTKGVATAGKSDGFALRSQRKEKTNAIWN